jgi:hypothetical protein
MRRASDIFRAIWRWWAYFCGVVSLLFICLCVFATLKQPHKYKAFAETSTVSNFPANDTSSLDDLVRDDPRSAEFVARVKLFYQSLQKKDWPTSYDMRTANFKKDVTKDFYLKQMADEGKTWNLNSYKVLNTQQFGNAQGEITATRIIMEFSETGTHSYNLSSWKKEGVSWQCEDPGLDGLTLLHSTRVPDGVE